MVKDYSCVLQLAVLSCSKNLMLHLLEKKQAVMYSGVLNIY